MRVNKISFLRCFSYTIFKYQIIIMKSNIIAIVFLLVASIKNYAFTNYSVIYIKTLSHAKPQVLLFWNHLPMNFIFQLMDMSNMRTKFLSNISSECV